jgi:hypothetical protein
MGYHGSQTHITNTIIVATRLSGQESLGPQHDQSRLWPGSDLFLIFSDGLCTVSVAKTHLEHVGRKYDEKNLTNKEVDETHSSHSLVTSIAVSSKRRVTHDARIHPEVSGSTPNRVAGIGLIHPGIAIGGHHTVFRHASSDRSHTACWKA